MFTPLDRFLGDESGATAVEYGLIVALVGVSVIAALQTLGSTLAGIFLALGDTLQGVLPALAP
jgi:pilus assembly protein Flp/PilA